MNTKHIVFIFTCSTVVILSIYSYYEYRHSKLPYNTPKEFLAKKRDPNKKLVVCLGDSLTQATMSYDYVQQLRSFPRNNEFEFVNAGINGELAYQIFQRLDTIIQCQPDYAVILVGTNDAYYNDKDRAKQAMQNFNLPALPTYNFFSQYYNLILQKVKQKTTAKILAISIPIITELPHSIPFQTTQNISKIIKDLAQENEVQYFGFNEYLGESLSNKTIQNIIGESLDFSVFFIPKIKHFLFGYSFDQIARENGVIYLIENVHLTEKGCKELIKAIIEFIQS